MGKLEDIIDAHDRNTTALVSAYTGRLTEIVSRAQARVLADLQRDLEIGPNGDILATSANRKVLRSIGTRFQDEMVALGSEKLNRAFTSQFPGQFVFFDQILNLLQSEMDRPLVSAKNTIGADAIKQLNSLRLTSVGALDGVVQTIGQQAFKKGAWSVGAVKFRDLADSLAESFHKTVAESEAVAETAISTFYRTIADNGFRVMEADLPVMRIRYRYAGPRDKKNRPFCRHLVDAKKDYSREEIDAMDNGQFPVGSCFITAGGWRCRHTWILAV